MDAVPAWQGYLATSSRLIFLCTDQRIARRDLLGHDPHSSDRARRIVCSKA